MRFSGINRLYLMEENISTFGVETMRPGKLIECEIGHLDEGRTSPTAYNRDLHGLNRIARYTLPHQYPAID